MSEQREPNETFERIFKAINDSRTNLGKEFTTGFETDECDLPIISDEFDELFTKIEAIRQTAHPHTPAPAPDVCEEHTACRIPTMCPETALAARKAREDVLKEQGLECWGHYKMNAKRCLKCSIAEMCYTKRECNKESTQHQAGDQR